MGLLNVPMAAAAIFGLLGSASAAYVTKKILDQKLKETESAGLDIPKVRRIIFKTQGSPETEEPEVSKTADNEVIMAMIGIYTDEITGNGKIMESPEVKAAMAKAAMPMQGLADGRTGLRPVKPGADVDALYAKLRGDPEMTKAIMKAYMSQHPVARNFSWALNMPTVRRYGENKMFEAMDKVFRPKMRAPVNMPPDFKAAAMPVTTPALVAGMVGGQLLGADNSREDLVKAVVEAQKKMDELKAQENEQAHPEHRVSEIKVEAKGGKAGDYLKHNKQKVMTILKAMAEKGQI